MSDTKLNYGNNMLLTSQPWNNFPSFRMIPALVDCPYQEVIYDRIDRMLVIISKIPKEHIGMLPRLDTSGDTILAKKPRQNGKNYQEQRVTLNTVQEYYIENQKEIENFIEAFAINASEFDFKSLLEKVKDKQSAPTIIQGTPVILDAQGTPIEK